jgi:hypothetical protein
LAAFLPLHTSLFKGVFIEAKNGTVGDGFYDRDEFVKACESQVSNKADKFYG